MTIAPLLRGMASVMQNLWTGLSFFTWVYQPWPGCALWVNNEVMSFLVVSTNHICQLFFKKHPILSGLLRHLLCAQNSLQKWLSPESNAGTLAYKAIMMTITPPSQVRQNSRKPKQVWRLRHCYAGWRLLCRIYEQAWVFLPEFTNQDPGVRFELTTR